MFLSKFEFAKVVSCSPLVSIDICILKGRELLLGKRINSPAKNFFFVPGGRILKSELINNALRRILKDELGLSIKKNHNNSKQYLGTYEHFYDDNFLDNKEFGTHYIVLAYLLPYESLETSREEIISQQHSKYIWLDIDKFKDNSLEIHCYTLDYLKNQILINYLF